AGHRRPRPRHRHQEAKQLQRRPPDPHRRADRQADQGGVVMKSLVISHWLLVIGVAAIGLIPFNAAATNDKGQDQLPANEAQDFVFLGESRPVLVRLHVRMDGKSLEAAWNDFMKDVFAYLDVDGDGVLSKAEAERAPSVDLLRGGAL